MTSYPLLESYLAEIARHLPRNGREDVLGELRDDLTEQVKERAHAAGRAADSEDEHAVLRLWGHPLKLASQYKSRRYLIGPEIYPAYLQTLRITLLIGLGVWLLFAIVVGAINENSPFIQTLSLKGLLNTLVEIGIWTAGIVTVVFLSIESSGEGFGWYKNWTPDRLSVGSAPLDYSAVVTNLVTEAVFLLMWNRLVGFGWTQYLLEAENTAGSWLAEASVAPTLGALFYPMNVLVGLFLGLHIYVLVRGFWPRWASKAELGLCLVLSLLLMGLVSTSPLIVLSEDFAKLSFWVNGTIGIMLLVVLAASVWDGWLAYRRAKPQIL